MPDPAAKNPDIDPAIDAAVRAWSEREARAVSTHPSADDLVDYQEGRLGGSAAEALRRHLVRCVSCRQELLSLEACDQEQPEDRAAGPTAEDTERSWQRFEKLRAEARHKAPQPITSQHPQRATAAPAPRAATLAARRAPSPRPPSTPWLLAASITLALAAGAFLAGWLLGHDATGQESVPGSPFIFDLEPAGSGVLRGAVMVPEIVVPPGMDPLVARLNLGDLREYQAYWVEIRSGERQILRRMGLSRDPAGSVAFQVPRSALPSGTLMIRLFGRRDGQPHELASYTLKLRFDG